MRHDKHHLSYTTFDNISRISPFGTLCTLLRVGGIENYYNAYEESKNAFNDFNWILLKAKNERTLNCFRRIGLLIYCQAVEMTVPHNVLANLLRCALNQEYVVDPFQNLYRSRKKNIKIKRFMIPPSAKGKFNRIGDLAKEANLTEIKISINSFFNEDVRNSFSHSDYVLTDTHFNELKIEELDRLFCECFGFYEAFFAIYKGWLMSFGKNHRYFKWPNYEVLELLRNDEEGLIGFNLHYSNGNKSTYKRSQSGVEAINIGFDIDGKIEFFQGSIDDLCPVWKVDGKPIY